MKYQNKQFERTWMKLNDRVIKEIHGYKLTNYFSPTDNNGIPRYNALVQLPVQKLFQNPKISDLNFDRIYNDTLIILNDLGFVLDVYPRVTKPRGLFNRNPIPPKLGKYDLIYGVGENCHHHCKIAPESTYKIGWVTGEESKSTLLKTYERIDQFNRNKSTYLNKYRLGHTKYQPWHLYDALVINGDIAHKRRYEERYPHNHVVNIHFYMGDQGSRCDANFSPEGWQTKKKNFLYFAGNGPVLKCLDLVIDSFKKAHDLDLYICSNHHTKYEQFGQLYEEELKQSQNIHDYGWVRPFSDNFYKVINKCGFHIYPSTSDVRPKSLIATSWYGLIPLMSRGIWDNLAHHGYRLNENSAEEILSKSYTLSKLPDDQLKQMSQNIRKHSRQKYSREAGFSNLKRKLESILRKADLD